MKVLFLDFDGVLNRYGVHKEAPKWAKWPFQWVEAKLVANLDDIIDAHPDLRIVISSTWRKSFDSEDLEKILVAYAPKVKNRVIGETPSNRSGNRGEEIQDWIDEQKKPSRAAGMSVKHYAILDDDSDMLPEQKPHFVQTNGYKGLSDADVQQVIQVLNKEIK